MRLLLSKQVRVVFALLVCSAVHGANLLSDGFETNPLTGGWSTNGGGRASWISNEVAAGRYAIAASNSLWMSPFIPTTPLQWHRLTFKSKGPGTVTNAGSDGYGYWAAVFFDTNGNQLNDDQYSSVFASSNWVSNDYRIRAKHTAGTNGTLVPARMKILFQALNAPLYIDDVAVETTTVEEVVRWADTVYDALPKLTYVPKASRGTRIARTMQKLQQGKPVRIVMLGDSVQQDTANAPLDALLQRLYPGATIELISSTRGGTGVQYYQNHVEQYVLAYRPDLLVIGGISHEDNLAAWQSVVKQVRNDDVARSRATEILVLSRQWSPNNTGGSFFLAPGMTELDPIPANNPVIPNDLRGHLLTFCASNNLEFLDMTGIASQFIYGPATAAGVGAPANAAGQPYGFWMRDWVHSNDRAKMILGRILEAYFAPAPKMRAGIHGDQISIEWPIALRGYYLESATTLTTNSPWVSNASTITATNGRYLTIAPRDVSARFFRLKRL